jgi:molybdopterin-guanine dinucleotide biosynthesis protein A
MKDNLTGILMCGGKSSRMGKDKYALLYNDLPLYKPALDTLQLFCNKIIISSNVAFPEFENFTLVEDDKKEIGPMGGIYSCLKRSTTKYNMVLACDMPLVSGGLMTRMLNIENDYDAIVPLVDGRPEPLYAIYNSSIIPAIAAFIRTERYSLKQMLAGLEVCYVPVDTNVEELKNVNTPTELME